MAATSRRTRSPPRSTSCIGGTGEQGQRLRPNAPAALPGSQGGPQLASSCSTVIPIGGRSLSIKTPQAARDAGCAIADMSGLRLRWRLLSFLRSSAWRYRPNLFSVAPSLKRAAFFGAFALTSIERMKAQLRERLHSRTSLRLCNASTPSALTRNPFAEY